MKTKRSLIQIYLLGLLLLLLQASIGDAQPVTKIAAGYNHSVFLKSDGSLWTMGVNSGLLDDGTNTKTNRPKQIVISGVTAIAAGSGYNLLLKNDGSLWASGNDQSGQLGDGHYNTYTNRPEQIVASGVTAIAAKYSHSLFIKSDGSLWAMGFNGFGKLGDGTFNQTNRPELIVSNGVTAIAEGQDFSLFLKSDGSLWAMGNNSQGELGDGTMDGGSYETNRPEQIVASGVTAIAAGDDYSLFLKSDGSLWGMGDNHNGELGIGDTDWESNSLPHEVVASNVTAIAAGGFHSLFLKSDGSLWGMGVSWHGELGDGTYAYTNRPEQIVASGVTAIAAGQQHSLFLKSNGSLWGMGANAYGQLGDGTYGFPPNNTTNRPEQILAAYNQISAQPLSGGNMQLSFVGIAGTNYALDRSFSLSPPVWVPQVTNPANSFGALVFTNTPNPATNNFWRIRSVP